MPGQLWAKFALNFVENPKIIGLSDTAFRAFIEAIIYARQHLTDGFLDARIVKAKWPTVTEELTTNDPQNPSWEQVEGGYLIHNFCEYQMTNEDIARKRQAQSENGKKSGEARRTKSNQTRTKVEPTSNQNELETETETETETELKEEIPPDGGKASRKTKIDLNWQPSENLRAWTRALAPGLDIDFERGKFVDWFAQSGKLYGDWEATWRNWVRRSVESNPALKIPPPPPKKQFGIEPENV